MVRRVVHHHHHHGAGGNGQFVLWLIGAAVAVLLLRFLFWVAVIAIGAWLIYKLWPVIAVALILIWKAVTFIGRSVGRLIFRRRPPAPKLIAHTEAAQSD